MPQLSFETQFFERTFGKQSLLARCSFETRRSFKSLRSNRQMRHVVYCFRGGHFMQVCFLFVCLFVFSSIHTFTLVNIMSSPLFPLSSHQLVSSLWKVHWTCHSPPRLIQSIVVLPCSPGGKESTISCAIGKKAMIWIKPDTTAPRQSDVDTNVISCSAGRFFNLSLSTIFNCGVTLLSRWKRINDLLCYRQEGKPYNHNRY